MITKTTKILLTLVALIFVMLAAGCIETTDQIAKINDTVNIYYILTLEDGTVYQTNIGEGPLNFVLGSGQVIKKLDDAIVGMKPNETKIVTLAPDQAYGTYSYDTYADIPISLAETYNNGSISIGSIFLMCDYSTGTIKVVQGEVMTIDNESNMTRVIINHPLAGKTLIFEITLDSINKESK
jgi:peptidylprolyl isomerase